ncbi:MAG: spore germination protein [Lachnospiraceae bacterium]|nr:spore germination protein [Lachnospiraceae bacterium]
MNQHYFDTNQTIRLSEHITDNILVLQAMFRDCDDIIQNEFMIGQDDSMRRAYMIYVDGLADNVMVQEHVIKPCRHIISANDHDFFDALRCTVIEMVDLTEETDFDAMITRVLSGDTALLVDGRSGSILISSKKLPLRGIEEAKMESVMRGPRDSFNESLRTGTALIRRRIRDSHLKIVQNTIGDRSRTDYALIYMEDLAKEELIDQIRQELSVYDIDAIYDSGMLEQFMHKKWYSPFPVIQSTERPDKAASALLEGRVALITDNSPEVMLFPATFHTFLQASDDYYSQWTVASFARILRYLASILAIGLPAFYIAITNYHIEMLPTRLLLAIAQARSLVTFPVITEVLLMELLFELLREAGIRLPGPLGNTIGIVGGLIVGQAAVEAELVSTIVVIVVALTALASYTIPNESFASAYRLLKFFLIFTSAVWGLYGFTLGMMIIGIHLSGLTSFGIPYMIPMVSANDGQIENKKDFILRLPLYTMRQRPVFTKAGNRIRIKKHLR